MLFCSYVVSANLWAQVPNRGNVFAYMIDDANKDYNTMASETGKALRGASETCNAYDDYAITYKGASVDVNVLANDDYPCTNPMLSLGVPKHGSATTRTIAIGNNPSVQVIRYTPEAGFIGRDTLTYTIPCIDNICSAKLVIVVLDKDDLDCFVDPFYKSWGIREAERLGDVAIYDVPKVGDLNGDGYPEILAANIVNTPSGLPVD